MKTYLFERMMRSYECYHKLEAAPSTYLAVRVDGRGFSKLTAENAQKPFDASVSTAMLKAAQELITKLNGVYAYTQSDEISVILDKKFNLFNRNIEKIVSISSSIASAYFSKSAPFVGTFDGRLSVLPNIDSVVDYLRWRQADAYRNSLNSFTYWTIMNKLKISSRKLNIDMLKMHSSAKRRKLKEEGVDWDKVPMLQKIGMGLYWATKSVVGTNPITKETRPSVRKELYIDINLPIREKYDEFVKSILEE